jgi:hypothetical protein
MAQSLEQFVAELKANVDEFSIDYLKGNAANPEHYPLELGGDNAGLWFELFIDYVTSNRGTDKPSISEVSGRVCEYCGGDGYHAIPQSPGVDCEACNGTGFIKSNSQTRDGQPDR